MHVFGADLVFNMGNNLSPAFSFATQIPDVSIRGMRVRTFHLPIRTISENNAREHWRSRHSRRKKQREDVTLLLKGKLDDVTFPCIVLLCRIAPRRLDTGDNDAGSQKSCRDAIAKLLGIDDRDERVTWKYDQKRGGVREYAVVVTITECDGGT